jgi:adenylosuccinate synthase
MPFTVIIGTQWGDEGKGRIVDAMAANADAVARFQGGSNAGHTVYVGPEKFILHLIPMGILNSHTLSCIGLGVVVDPLILVKELEQLRPRGIDPDGRLIIDPRCHLIIPKHIERDVKFEEDLGIRKIGTTRRGIGPAYADRASRTGLRLGSLINLIEGRNKVNLPQDYLDACLKLKPFLADVSLTLYKMLKEGKSILAEGGQGTMLDLGLGTYPYVTSSNTVAAAAPVNLGLGPKTVDTVIGVLKAYITRVGEGPFPTEMDDQMGEAIRRVGDEFGSTTGRARRVGWFDGLVAKYSARVNGVDKWALTKLDVLDDLDLVKAAVAYEVEGEILDEFPPDLETLYKIKPVYKQFPGWKRSTRLAKKLTDLPSQARSYLDFIQEFTGVGFYIVSVGYERSSMIML